MPFKLTRKDILSQFRIAHGKFYDYSQVEYSKQ